MADAVDQFPINSHESIVTFAVSRTVYEKFGVKQSNDLEISPKSPTFVSPESCRVISYYQFQFLWTYRIISEILEVGMTT